MAVDTSRQLGEFAERCGDDVSYWKSRAEKAEAERDKARLDNDMSVRDRFASGALSAVVDGYALGRYPRDPKGESASQTIARVCFEFADAMLEFRVPTKKEQENGR